MTTETFSKYLEDFEKKPGQYTLDELMEIGLKFKELPLKSRDWKALTELVGAPFSPDAYRMRIQKLIKKEQDLPDDLYEYKETFTEKQKVRDWYNAFRRNLREEVRIDNLKEEIKEAANKFSKLPVKKWVVDSNQVMVNKVKGKVIGVLLFSDLHLGVECDNYYNTFNLDVARERLSQLSAGVKQYCKSNYVDVLNVLNLGDLIHGLIHTNARIEAQMDVSEQIIAAGEFVSQFLNDISDVAPEITYRSVYDNHSRAIADKSQHIEKEQFSRVIDWMIQERLKNSPIKFIENEIDGGIGSLEIGDRRLIFVHGHNDSKNSSMQNFIGLTREWVDYVCMAHYHSPAAKDFQGCKVFINGSIVGTESYAFGKRLFTKPSQKLLIFKEDNETIQDIDISLD